MGKRRTSQTSLTQHLKKTAPPPPRTRPLTWLEKADPEMLKELQQTIRDIESGEDPELTELFPSATALHRALKTDSQPNAVNTTGIGPCPFRAYYREIVDQWQKERQKRNRG